MPSPTPDRGLRFWQAPLVPVALAFTAGIGLDRITPVSLATFFLLAIASLVLWLRRPEKSVLFLWVGAFFFGAAYHHVRIRFHGPDSLAHLTRLDEKPVRLKGRLIAEPQRRQPPTASSLRTFPAPSQASFLLGCDEVIQSSDVIPITGVVQVWLEGPGELPNLGDQVEVVGILHFPTGPANPGGLDRETMMRDQGILATLDADFSTCRFVEGSSLTYQPMVFISWLRQESKRLIERYVPEEHRGLAWALLLGDGSAMTNDDWEIYYRTGIMHVLAISGQHLVLLASFLAFFAMLCHLPRRRVALFIIAFLFLYAFIAGGRPPVMRSAWMVSAFSLAMLVRRPVYPVNSFAFAWIAVGIWQPGDLFQTGCLLSFLAVAVLKWGTLLPKEEDPVQELLAEQRPIWLNMVFGLLRWLSITFAINAIVWIAVAPLIAARMNLVSPVALVIGPPMVLGTSLALLSGFLTLLLGAILPPAGLLFGTMTGWFLSLCRWTVEVGDSLPAAYHYVADVPLLWLLAFYVGLLAFLTYPVLRRNTALFYAGCTLWLLLGWVIQLWPRAPGEFRCTFLAVGHGGCTVIETPDGGVFLYDAGAMAGPEVTRQHIAPFLWQRGIRHIDEVFLSHADLDHFNGIPALLDRFSVGQVNLTPTFEQRSTPGVATTLDTMTRRNIPMRILTSRDRLRMSGLVIDVLHPPSIGPDGNENARSMVLWVRHEGMSLLLTGDLEGLGLQQMLHLPPHPVDILMAPHHGSRASNVPELAKWARPRVVVSCQGRPKGEHPAYPTARYLTTWEHGAITVRRDNESTWIETFRTGQHWRVE